MHYAPDGLLAAGTPLGTTAFEAASAATCADKACTLMDRMQALPLADQDRWLLLHGSLQRRVEHLLRGSQWEQVGPAVHQAEPKAVACALAIAGHTTEEGPLTDQVTFPLRLGGLGLSRTSPALGRAAYLAASAAAHIATLGGSEAFWPFDGPSSEVLRPQWQALHSEAADLLKPKLKEVTSGTPSTWVTSPGPKVSLHGTRPNPVSTRSTSATMPTACKGGARARLLSCACRPTSAWLDTLPCTPALELKSGEVRTSLHHRLGLSMLSSNAPAV
jgi:hypothetical protein